jgi:DMSO/TMAO reductase YedYZ heme-binding membrane subunit
MPYPTTSEEPRLIQDGLDAFRIVMPRRRLGRLRWVGIAPVVFGLGIVGFFHSWLAGPLDMFSRGADTAGLVFAAIFALVAVPGLLAGAGMFLFGLMLMANRSWSELVVDRRRVRVIEHFGILHRSWKRPIESLAAISLERPIPSSTFSELGAIRLATDGDDDENGVGKLEFAVGYPRESLKPVIESLRRLFDQTQLAGKLDWEQPSEEDEEEEDGEDVESSAKPASPRAAPEPIKPMATKIVLTRDGDATAFVIPASGLFRGQSLFLIIFSLMFLAIPGGMMVMVVRESEPYGILLFLGIFVAVGLATLAYGVKTGTTRTMLAVTPDVVAFQHNSVFGMRKRQISRQQITGVSVGPSGTTVNDRPLLELQISVRGAPSEGMLVGRSVEELNWIAATLRQALGLDAKGLRGS